MTGSPGTKRILLGVTCALVVWAVYLSVGVTGIFVQDSMRDLRKSGIVLVCVGLFLALWWIMLSARAARSLDASAEVTTTGPSLRPLAWSRPGLTSVGLASLGLAVWASAAVSWQAVSASTTTVLGWAAAGLILGGGVAAMIALSDRSRCRGKWLGYVGLLTFIAAMIGFYFRMRP